MIPRERSSNGKWLMFPDALNTSYCLGVGETSGKGEAFGGLSLCSSFIFSLCLAHTRTHVLSISFLRPTLLGAPKGPAIHTTELASFLQFAKLVAELWPRSSFSP